MSSLGLRDMGTRTERGREFWRRMLLAGPFTVLPRWTREPAAGVGEHEARIPDDLVAALRRLADDLGVPFHSVLLTAHAKVLAALSGDREVSTAYVARQGPPPLLCRLTTEPHSCRARLREANRAEVELLPPADFAAQNFGGELG